MLHRSKAKMNSSAQSSHPKGLAVISPSPSLSQQPIDINQDASVDYWVNALDCSEFELRVAVAEVGPVAGDVSNELGHSV